MFPFAKNLIPHLVANLHKLCARAVLPREKQAVVVDSKKYEMLCIFARQKRDKKLCNVSFYEEFIPHLVANLYQLCAKAVLPREKQAVVVESKTDEMLCICSIFLGTLLDANALLFHLPRYHPNV